MNRLLSMKSFFQISTKRRTLKFVAFGSAFNFKRKLAVDLRPYAAASQESTLSQMSESSKDVTKCHEDPSSCKAVKLSLPFTLLTAWDDGKGS